MKTLALLLMIVPSVAQAAGSVSGDLEQAALICRLHHARDANGAMTAGYMTGYESCSAVMTKYHQAQKSASSQTEKDNQSFVSSIATQK